MAQTTDRWVSKVLALPIFSARFSDALVKSPLANLALVASIEVQSGAEFVQKISEWASAMDGSVAEALLAEPAMLDQFWGVARAIEKMFFESTTTQLGFGLCERAQAHRALSDADVLRKRAAIQALVQKPMKVPRKLKTDPSVASGSTPLLDMEQAERHRWAARLEAIGRRAGNWAKLFEPKSDDQELTPTETAKLRQLVLTSGAHRTMSAHVRVWERWELWAASVGLSLYPLSLDKVLKYCLWLDQQECGPTVIPSVRSSIRWVSSRLAIECPDLDDAQLVALQKEVVLNRATTLKEAVPVPMEVVRCMELYVAANDVPDAARLFVWWWLCLIYASLRFDDGIHVSPKELAFTDDGLFGVSWQTKVERKRRGTKFVVPIVSLSGVEWLAIGWDLFDAPSLDRDFWMPDLNSREEFRNQPPEHARSVQWLKVLSRAALERFVPARNFPAGKVREWAATIGKFTAHSARVTMLDAAVHAGRSTEEIGLQANWKNPGPLVLKYTRNRSSVPANMVQELVREMLALEHPHQESEEVFLDTPEALSMGCPEFFLKQPAPGSYYDYRYHCSHETDQERTACNKFLLEECCSMGTVLPDLSVFCKACSRARPEIAASFDP